MKRFIPITALALMTLIGCTHLPHAPKSLGTSPSQVLAQADVRVADRIALKELIDRFSNLADEKKIDEQVLLFTENAQVVSLSNGQTTSTLQGRAELARAFKAFLDNFHTVYHQNGQQVIEFTGQDTAKSVHYSTVYLAYIEQGKQMVRASTVRYHDEYVRENSKWLISKRTSEFLINEVRPLNP